MGTSFEDMRKRKRANGARGNRKEIEGPLWTLFMAPKMTTFRQLLGVFAMYSYFLVCVLTGACIKIPAIVRKYSGNATQILPDNVHYQDV